MENKGIKKGEEISSQMPVKRYFTLREASFYLGRGVYGVRELIWKGRLPIIRDGRKIYVDREDLDGYMLSLKENYFLRESDERVRNGKEILPAPPRAVE